MPDGPRRIACLTTETVDLLYRLGAQDRIVGVSGFTQFPPEARQKPFVSTFTTVHYDLIDSLRPDLILGFSDLQADAARELIRRGYPVLVTNQRTLAETFDTMRLIGRVIDMGREAERLVADLQTELAAVRRRTADGPRPRVYFEEWDDPSISGLSWVSELIEAAGGDDVFRELACRAKAAERIVEAAEVARRLPEVVIASWCGKPVRFDAIRSRPGWHDLPAVRDGELHEVKSCFCLQPGPILIAEGLPRFCRILEGWRKQRSGSR